MLFSVWDVVRVVDLDHEMLRRDPATCNLMAANGAGGRTGGE